MSEPIRDGHGRAISAERLEPPAGDPTVVMDLEGAPDFYLLTPEKAIEFGKQLQEAGEGA